MIVTRKRIYMNKAIKCLRCDAEMLHKKSGKIQLGQTGWMLGDLPNLLAGALEVDIFCCPVCGKIELFCPDNTESDKEVDTIAQIKCPQCGRVHDMDYPKCPVCGYNYNK